MTIAQLDSMLKLIAFVIHHMSSILIPIGMGGRTPTEEEGYRMKELENLRLLYRKTKSCICTIQSSSHLPYSDHQLTLASHGLTALLMLIKNHIGTVTSYLRFRTE